MTFIIYELKQLQRLDGAWGIILASSLYHRLEKPQPLLFFPWRQVAALLPLCQATLILLIIWQFTAKAGKSVEGFQKV